MAMIEIKLNAMVSVLHFSYNCLSSFMLINQIVFPEICLDGLTEMILFIIECGKLKSPSELDAAA